MIARASARSCLPLVACCRRADPAAAQSVRRDTTALEFHGFRAGARLDELAARGPAAWTAADLRCDRAKADRARHRVPRHRSSDPELGGAVNLWMSAIDSIAGVMTLSAGVTADQLDSWRPASRSRYGRVDAQVQGVAVDDAVGPSRADAPAHLARRIEARRWRR